MRATLEQLKHFQAVVRFSNLNLAATKINISPSALSRSIKIIEEDLGYLLFKREGRNIYLTLDGDRFYQKSLLLIEEYQFLFSSRLPGEIKGTFKVGASHWLAGNYLPPYLDELVKIYPLIKFELLSQDSHLLVSKVLSGELDLAICFSPLEHPELGSQEIAAGQLALCAGTKHPLIYKTSKEVLKLLNEYEAIVHKPNALIYRCDNHPMFTEHNICPNFRFFWDSDFIAISLLKSNHYWSLIPDIIISNTNEIKKLAHPKNWDAPYTVNAIWNKKQPPQHIDILLASFK